MPTSARINNIINGERAELVFTVGLYVILRDGEKNRPVKVNRKDFGTILSFRRTVLR